MRVMNKLFYFFLDLQKWSIKRRIEKIDKKMEIQKNIITEAEKIIIDAKVIMDAHIEHKKDYMEYLKTLDRLE